MGLIGPIIFAVFMLILGLIATTNPSAIMHFYERLGKRSPLDETTTRWSIRSSGVIALLMAAFIFWAIFYGRNP
jgi:uncharacterized BrkB/YihY/UPF0761 family membrane protein